MIWDVRKAFKSGDELGIDFEEKAFYDILKSLCIKYDFTYPEYKLIVLSKEVKKLIQPIINKKTFGISFRRFFTIRVRFFAYAQNDGRRITSFHPFRRPLEALGQGSPLSCLL